MPPSAPFIPAEEVVVADLETLRVIADPLRVRLREQLTQPATVKQLAQQLVMSATKRYYYINHVGDRSLL